jgi:hypothetical protein
MSAEQAEIYRQAIAPLQEALLRAKAARQNVFYMIKGSLSQSAAPAAIGFDAVNPQGT